MELHILEHRLQVASVAKESLPLFTYGLIKLAFLSSKTRCKFFSLTETPEDYTIIVDEEGFLELPSSEHLSVADATWLALNVVSGGGSFSSSQPIGVTKIAKSVIAPLADQNISVFMLSTYQTDFILVRERDLPFVTHTLSSEFTILRVVNGETVAAENLGITNGFVKPKMVQRPVIHPLSSPSNSFCVTSLDPDTLPAVATLLMDVMFYSNGPSRGFLVTCCSRAHLESSGRWCGSEASPWDSTSVASWPRSPSPWPLRTSPPTTSVLSSSTTHWYQKKTLTASSAP
ncbi:cytosolic arginine sensor for mTORC1 subunit 2 isoform X2 [Myotis myotis]|uniref:cytosolic arginine sensor for mTORC1 subunit 2 isoform X2 n=1 Tax=Myotis myotis TaxID=51298 RepID=UPI00174A2C4D|nr:cytosolic arginine sensor for mTORC1 subunit 2 isoform X2 [Myotis myotis]